MASRIIYLVSLLEGFATLAVEVLAIRAATPIVWSSIILTSIFLWVILLALSAWYYAWGTISQKLTNNQRIWYLSWCLLFAWVYYVVITFPNEVSLIEQLLALTQNYVVTLFLVALLLFFIPVFVESQSIPLLTELTHETSKGKAAWDILFVSTLGSFLWSVVPSILLFETIGVSMTMLIVWNMLFISSGLLLLPKKRSLALLVRTAWIILSIVLYFVHPAFKRPAHTIYAFDSAYQEILVRETTVDDKLIRFFQTDRSYASAIYVDTKESPFTYARETMDIIEKLKPASILVIWTAWFTLPFEAAKLSYVERIDAIDIDPRVKDIAEKHFLFESLPQKITFYPESARFFVNQAIQSWKKYDVILIDAYNWKSLPEELVTYEFFSWIKQLIRNPSWLIFNFIHDTNTTSGLAVNVYTTLSYVFGDMYTKNVSQNKEKDMDNFIVTTQKFDRTYISVPTEWTVYTDDKRTTELDVVKMRWFGS